MVVPSALADHTQDDRHDGAFANDWSGTVRVVTDFPFQTQPVSYGSFGYSRHDEAVYTLSGETTAPGESAATMQGSGAGRAVNTFTSAGCVAPVDPVWEWTYSGPATVAIGYENGEFSIRPRGVQGTVRNFYANPSCAGGSNEPFAMVVPPNIEEASPTAKQQGPSTQQQLKGQQSFRWLRNTDDSIAGTMTVSWDLRRSPGIVPVGTASGDVIVNGKPYSSGAPIPFGSTVDVTNGRLTLTAQAGTVTAYGAGISAEFKLLRAAEQGKPLVEMRLVRGDFSVCKKRVLSVAGKAAKPVRRLWVKGKGKFRTRARYASAAIRGTWWLTADYCDRTQVSVREGSVLVTDLAKKKKAVVSAGKSYSALPRR